jgi:two-component system, NtrC family, sensor kinase
VALILDLYGTGEDTDLLGPEGREIWKHGTPIGVQLRNGPRFRSALSIALGYAAAAALWIVTSDILVDAWADNLGRHTLLSIGKGLFFVSVTSVGLFFMVRAQLHRLHDADRHAEQVERTRRLGELAARITHDFNNVLAACASFAAVLRRVVAEPRARNVIEQLDRAVRRGESLTREILTFAQPPTPSPRRVELAPFLDVLVSDLRSMLPGVQIQQNVSPADLAVSVDPDHLHRVLTNLALNARDAMPSGGLLTIAAHAARNLPGFLESGANGSDFVELCVTDTGVGIEQAALKHIFEPHFTTKPTGTGLGLAIVQRVVSENRGYVRATSRVGEGTTMTVLLPRSKER